MGAGQSIESSLWSSTFELQSKNSQLGIIRLTDKQTEDSYICRKISTLDKKQIQQYDRLIDIKLSLQSPYVTKLQKAENQKNQEYCSYGKTYYLLFKQPYQTLKQETLNRKFKNSMYSETELQLMLEVGVKALSFLRNIDHPHENLSSTAFFVNENRSLVLGDPFMFPKENRAQITRNGFVYPSPQLIKFQNHEVQFYNRHLSDLFTFGLVLLEVFYMINMDCVYQRYFQRLDYEAIRARLNSIKGQQLKKKLFILLDLEPKNRETIFKYYAKSISSNELFNKLSKEKFKKTIDRYNLATSEVTEWKNDLPVEYRLNSSDGKRTFSISTAENNLLNQEKNSNYYEREYGQNHNLIKQQSYSSQQYPQYQQQYQQKYQQQQYQQHQQYQLPKNDKFVDNIPRNYYQPNTAASISQVPAQLFQANLNRQIYKPSQDFSKDNYSRYKFQSSPAILSHISQLNSSFNFNNNKPQNIVSNNLQYQSQYYNFSTSPSINYFVTGNQTIPIYHANQQFNGTSNRNVYPSDGSLNKMGQVSQPYHDSNKQFIVQKQSQTHSIQNKKLSKVIHNHNEPQDTSKVINKADEKSLLMQTQMTELLISNSQKNNFLQTKLQIPAISHKKDSSTPHKQKAKRNSSDYGILHHLSTINERSQMTESFVSDYQQKKSDILIQQDQPNIGTERQCHSQQENIENFQKEESKVWNITYPSGTRYIGEIKNDKRNGLGTFFYIDGSKYHGHWLDNKMNGLGTLYYPNGKIAYEGEWKTDNFHGKGKVFNDQIANFDEKYNYKNCTDIDNFWLQYDGELFQDRKQGKGTLKLANGEYFDAFFKNDELNGVCKFYTRDNKIIEGRWENNKLIEVLSQKDEI